MAIMEFLYGEKDGSQMKHVFGFLKHLEELAKWDQDAWKSLAHRFLLDQPYVCVVGKPSAEKARQIEKEEEAR